MSLVMRNVRKAYGANQVLAGVDLDVRPGEVHALLGPNGAGKSTLIKCIGGGTGISSGSIELDGHQLEDLTPAKAFDAGIVTIHQHLSLINTISVTDNLFFGDELARAGLIRRARQRTVTRSLLDQHRINVNPNATVGDLSIGVRQQIEIAKAWNRTSIKVLILDEPTAAISASETETLFEKIAALRESGVAVVYTTHRMAEVFRIADRVTVLNAGVVSLSGATTEFSADDIVEAISSGTSGRSAAVREHVAASEASAAEFSDLEGRRFGPISFSVGEGETVGLFGAIGAGRTSFLESIVGVYGRRALTGQLKIGGRRYRAGTPARAQRHGIQFVASDRTSQGLWASLSARENTLMSRFRELSRWGIRQRNAEAGEFRSVAEDLALQPPDPGIPAGDLSGGNQQKIVVGRVGLGSAPLRLLVLDDPTQGVDVGARARIYEFVRRLQEEHRCGVLVASSEPEELMTLCDRVLVMSDGRIERELVGSEITEKNMMLAAHQFVA